MTDIDIDFAQRARVVASLPCIPAALHDRRPHPSGVYFQDIPRHPLDGMAVWEHRHAADLGYFKIDFLSTTIYDGVRDESHLVTLLTTEPKWDAFDDPMIVNQLAHLKGNFAFVQAIRPRSIEDLAICLALIRPGKRHLINKSRADIDAELWTKTDEYHFKRSHAIAYAAAIVVQLNLLYERHHPPLSADPADTRL